MSFVDKQLNCRECGKPFTWTAGEQEFFATKGFTHPPSRCKEHRLKHKAQLNGLKLSPLRKEYEIICSNCGKPGTVPFEPKDKDTLLCADCFMSQRVIRSKGEGAKEVPVPAAINTLEPKSVVKSTGRAKKVTPAFKKEAA